MSKKKKGKKHLLSGKTVAFFGQFSDWPRYHGGSPCEVVKRLGASVCTDVDSSLDFLVIGDGRQKGRATAIRKAIKLNSKDEGSIEILDEPAFRDLVRLDMAEKRFAFCGGFDCCPQDFDAKLLSQMVEAVGAIVQPEIDESLDYLVVGNRRAKGKSAAQRAATELKDAGASIAIIDEEGFLELVRQEMPKESDEMSFPTFVGNLYSVVNEKKIQRAMKMLQSESFQLYSILDDHHLIGVVKSQTRDDIVYVPYLENNGRYGCTTTDLSDCMGLQGSPCKHLLVLMIGLVQAGEFDSKLAWTWIRDAGRRSPKRDLEFTTKILLQYKGVVAGEVDWRPTETIPEDYYSL
ncbi:hypothetical protein LOC67_06890 [Stieleria sp. JC731]|uniref:hypothetical protein n=1 Tax=Pirellulaceae TaxID=2691357 RepID=UPI001E42C9A5|nr:hypothetical protein [Stieleria sp. JC731]MCC9600282.1 hypothetical protein [Stieleria sp. JC731]